MRPQLTLITLATLCALHLPAAHAALILEYKFNDSGTTTASTGPTTTVLNLQDSAGAAADLHSADTLGVSGLAGDKALDLTSATGMGNAGTGGKATGTHPSALDNMTSFTVQGWFKTQSVAIGGTAYLLTLDNGAGAIIIRAESTNRLTFKVDALQTTNTGTTAYDDIGTWTFFAITYNGTAATSNVIFYTGGIGTAVSQVSIHSLDSGTVGNLATRPLIFGGSAGVDRPFDGYMDNMRIFGSTTDDSGVLSRDDLEAIRSLDVIPEPSPFALLATVVAGTLGLRRRRLA